MSDDGRQAGPHGTGLQVIGAGFGRTGTLSLKVALQQLGFRRCHHMKEVVPSRRQAEAWHALSRGETRDWDEIFAGFRASCDWPSAAYWEALHRHYPDARVILTVRDPERWYTSVKETIYPLSTSIPGWLARVSPHVRRLREMIDTTIWDGVFDGRFEDREYAIARYQANVERVKETVAPERLLVFEAKEGWEPLCRFLGVPVPETPYPHVNDAASMKRALPFVRGARWVPAFVAVLLVLLFLL